MDPDDDCYLTIKNRVRHHDVENLKEILNKCAHRRCWDHVIKYRLMHLNSYDIIDFVFEGLILNQFHDLFIYLINDTEECRTYLNVFPPEEKKYPLSHDYLLKNSHLLKIAIEKGSFLILKVLFSRRLITRMSSELKTQLLQVALDNRRISTARYLFYLGMRPIKNKIVISTRVEDPEYYEFIVETEIQDPTVMLEIYCYMGATYKEIVERLFRYVPPEIRDKYSWYLENSPRRGY